MANRVDGDSFENVHGSTIISRSPGAQQHPRAEAQVDPWYRRPLGLIVLGVVISVLASLAWKVLGG